jgi:ADP-ribosylglycohydrolase
MLGAIIGDLAGSIYEYEQIFKVKPVEVDNIIEENSFISDDTILTIAIADAIINKVDYGDKLREYALNYGDKVPQDIPYFKTMFSPNFLKWAKSNTKGESMGNGAMMRISPV